MISKIGNSTNSFTSWDRVEVCGHCQNDWTSYNIINNTIDSSNGTIVPQLGSYYSHQAHQPEHIVMLPLFLLLYAYL